MVKQNCLFNLIYSKFKMAYILLIKKVLFNDDLRYKILNNFSETTNIGIHEVTLIINFCV